MSLLEQNTIKRIRIDIMISQIEFNNSNKGNEKAYEFRIICNNIV